MDKTFKQTSYQTIQLGEAIVRHSYWFNNQRNNFGRLMYGNRPEGVSEYTEFEGSVALAHLLIEDVVFINDHWFEGSWDEKQKGLFGIYVNCNDTFFPASDAEEVVYNELENLYEHYEKDNIVGPLIWVAQKRKLWPWKRYTEQFKDSPAWKYDEESKDWKEGYGS